jgi:hypothetical protein
MKVTRTHKPHVKNDLLQETRQRLEAVLKENEYLKGQLARAEAALGANEETLITTREEEAWLREVA